MRNAMFLQTDLRRAESDADGEGAASQTLRVRNLSAGGLMVETDVGTSFARGERVILTLRNIGEVPARIAWTDGQRVGISFDRPIDPATVRKMPVKSPGAGMQLIRPVSPRSRRPGLKTGPA
ncbi:PilZ domain-containing protein [Sphingomonas jatrophae]|uniref:PilZ domain-containing protein n=1 Tax=Sphingomonas jatrophae TaxID=1166337 RepID=A0A1I6JHW7_9SPHN|nr:PilZ domain-containing protein [Sphingomonas jatrophae]SFR78616.1 PilZ domain-containing protein [Sphingomonas jatrophae]